MSSFHKNKENEIPMVGSKVIVSINKLTRPGWFLRYLNHFNSDFDL